MGEKSNWDKVGGEGMCGMELKRMQKCGGISNSWTDFQVSPVFAIWLCWYRSVKNRYWVE